MLGLGGQTTKLDQPQIAQGDEMAEPDQLKTTLKQFQVLKQAMPNLDLATITAQFYDSSLFVKRFTFVNITLMKWTYTRSVFLHL